MGMNNGTGETESNKDSGYIHFPCPVCGNNDDNLFRVLYKDTLRGELPRFDYDFTPEHNKTYRIIVCKKCSHRYASPRPVNLWENYRDTEDIKYLKQKDDNMLTAQKVIERMHGFSKSGRLLDVGCSTGDFLAVAKDFYDVEGLELSEWASDVAAGRDLKIHRCGLDVLSSKKQDHYDIITLWAVIEHFEFPEKELKNITKLLKKGGLVCLWTGNAHSILAKI
jgi:2-polyprenyl-3-methyl-5-hydroxy-6-metoxy-1,4-benzoquinol methylase